MDKKPKKTTPKAVKQEPIVTEGIGSKIEKLTSLLGIRSCDKCKERRDFLNNLFPMEKANPMSDEELIIFEGLKDKRQLVNEELNQLEQIYFKSFNINKRNKLCRSCPAVWINIIQKLTKVMEVQKAIDDVQLQEKEDEGNDTKS